MHSMGLDPRTKLMIECNGRAYGVPFMTDEYAVTYNKDHFSEVGLDEDRPPATWDELRTYARRLTKRSADGRLERSGFALRVTGAVGGIFDKWSAFLWSAGGDLVDPAFERYSKETKPAFYNDAGRAAAQFYYDLLHVDQVYESSMGDSRSLFRSLRASMQYSEHRAVTYHARNLPHLRYGLAVPPAPAGKRRPVTKGWTGYALQVTSYSKKQDVAFDVLRFFLEPENDLTRAVLLGATPYNVRNFGRQQWLDLPGMRDLPQILYYARPGGINIAYYPLRDILGEALQNFWSQKIPLENALADANRRAQAVIGEIYATAK